MRAREVVLDPCFPSLDDMRVGDLYERFEIAERKWIEIEAPDEQTAPVDRRHLCVQDRLGPLVDGDARLEKPAVQSLCGCARERDVAPAGKQ